MTHTNEILELAERAVLALERIAGALKAEPLPVSEKAVLRRSLMWRAYARARDCMAAVLASFVGLRPAPLSKPVQ